MSAPAAQLPKLQRVDIADVRARCVTGWRLHMSVHVQVATLAALLDELEALRSAHGE